jgi:hypothetical protein
MATNPEEPKYVCATSGCGEDLTQQVEDKLPLRVAHLMTIDEKPEIHRIFCRCSKGHVTIFSVEV